MVGEKLRELREANGLAQRQVAAELAVDTAYVCKLEADTMLVSRKYLKKLSVLFDYPEHELLTLWLASKLYKLVKDEAVALQAMELARQAVVDHSLPNQPNGR
jgi:transcriptional regulator with XRE-family HTH domain